jgi:acetyl esterase/lipase
MKNMKRFSQAVALYIITPAILIATSCNSQGTNNNNEDSTTVAPADTSSPQKVKDLKPMGAKPDWGPSINDNMLVVIEKLQSLGGKPIETLTAAEARKQPTPAQAVMAVMKDNNIPLPPTMVDTAGKDIPVKGGTIHARVYTPRVSKDKYPIIVYYHGGGWVIADLDTYDASPKGLAEQTGAVVVSVHYRQGPEHKFPTAHNDAFAAYEWVLKNAADIKGDTSKIVVVGESAGGNLACNVSMMARDKKIKMPLRQVLVYPVANNDMNSESYKKYAMAKPLNKGMMAWFAKNFLPSMSASGDKRFSLVKADLKNLPPTTIIAAEIDPLQTEGKQLSEQLDKAGVKTDYKLYDGVTHEFFGMATVLPEAKEAQARASDAIKDSFEK